jgi:3-oxoacyl-[acyl-carrier protein] reductase
VACSLHEAGASVGLLSRRGEDLGLERGLGVACDVSDRGAVERATAEVVERFGRLDIAVANAGVGSYGPFLELDPDELEAIIDVNLKGTLYTAAATLPHLIASGPGGVNTEFAIGTGREHGDPDLEQMMSAEDVAEVVLFAVTRPRNLRILTTSFRPMSEGSFG